MIKADERDVRSLCALFMLGSIVIIGGTAENASRSWLSLVLSVTIALPLLALWVWILGRFPDKDLFGVLGELFGKLGGKLFAGLIGVYAFITLSWTLGNYTSFTTMLTSRDTVKEVPGMLVGGGGAGLSCDKGSGKNIPHLYVHCSWGDHSFEYSQRGLFRISSAHFRPRHGGGF